MAYVVKQVFSGRSARPSNLERTLEYVSSKYMARRHLRAGHMDLYPEPRDPDIPRYFNISDINPAKLSGGHLDIEYSNSDLVYHNLDTWFNAGHVDAYSSSGRLYTHSKPMAGYISKRNAYRASDLNYLNSNDYTTYYDIDTVDPDYVDFDNWFNYSPEDDE